ncbi:MAG: peptide-modifying radical SAM enzyme CbpB [Oligoflexia bacterium]|nr:peptide-modifying radical SAM enzyme CbpB [Oligoflexia bacterium]MBF0365056.1 peptide-modifying radical SAM enzyme CbpB [Oligoflexia bacterium]
MNYANSGEGPSLIPMEIGSAGKMALISPDTAFWSIVSRDQLGAELANPKFIESYQAHAKSFQQEMENLRFHLKTTAVYFNPTDRCNLNCDYCYIPIEKRKHGDHMSMPQLLEALTILKRYFATTLPSGRLPDIIFHGSEPMMNKEAMFAGIAAFQNDFRFGVQTNATLLDEESIEFLKRHRVAIGLSLDSHLEEVANSTRKSWENRGAYQDVLKAMQALRGYNNYSVICTATVKNMHHLPALVEFFHQQEVPVCMLNPVRCTLAGAREVRPSDGELAKHYLRALDRAQELYKESGRKLVVANFANVLVSIVAPTARKLMCDISPCGGGRSFFALSAQGDLYPCSEFIGLAEFNGGNLFTSEIPTILKSRPFAMVRERKVENIHDCAKCVIRHFCGSPCPAEAYNMNGGMEQKGAFCELYEEQVRYAFRLIARGEVDDYLWDNWSLNLKTSYDYSDNSN